MCFVHSAHKQFHRFGAFRLILERRDVDICHLECLCLVAAAVSFCAFACVCVYRPCRVVLRRHLRRVPPVRLLIGSACAALRWSRGGCFLFSTKFIIKCILHLLRDVQAAHQHICVCGRILSKYEHKQCAAVTSAGFYTILLYNILYRYMHCSAKIRTCTYKTFVL